MAISSNHGELTQAEVSKAVQCRREYERRWRDKNRDKLRAYKMRYWLRRAEQAEAEGGEGDARH